MSTITREEFVQCLMVVRSAKNNRGNWNGLDIPFIMDMEFVWSDEDGEPIMGPDGIRGWFNCGTTDSAFRHINPTTVRNFLQVYGMFVCMVTGESGLDYELMDKFLNFTK